ncbi:MAG: hypothetical protein HFF17_07535 [Oscillospiraceae bacterium]|nr:hypothetical protein [Oscillospiraceae bacterium]
MSEEIFSAMTEMVKSAPPGAVTPDRAIKPSRQDQSRPEFFAELPV